VVDPVVSPTVIAPFSAMVPDAARSTNVPATAVLAPMTMLLMLPPVRVAPDDAKVLAVSEPPSVVEPVTDREATVAAPELSVPPTNAFCLTPSPLQTQMHARLSHVAFCPATCTILQQCTNLPRDKQCACGRCGRPGGVRSGNRASGVQRHANVDVLSHTETAGRYQRARGNTRRLRHGRGGDTGGAQRAADERVLADAQTTRRQ
jgi:hypothetical protein